MKKLIILIALVLLYACDKAKDCPEIIKGKSQSYLLTNEETTTVKSLFESNKLKFDNLQCYKLGRDLGLYSVNCHQYVNNLRIISGYIQFVFNQGKFSFLSGDTVSQISANPTPSMNISKLRTIFLQEIKNDNEINLGKNAIVKNCLLCELGYYNINRGTGNPNPDFELAWLVKPDGNDFPYAIINDSQKSLITYFNGMYH